MTGISEETFNDAIQKINDTLDKMAFSQSQDRQTLSKNTEHIKAILLTLKEESAKNTREFNTMEMRLTEAKGHSIYKENETEFKSIKDKLPGKTVLSDLPKFKGTEDPIIHIRAFRGQMSIKGIDKELWPTIFPHSLETIPQAWFYSMDPKKVETFDEISIEFDNQYRDNVDTQATMRTLEILSQRDNEGFTEYLTRWKNISNQIPNRANER